MPERVVLLFSGGLDSTVLLWQLRKDGYEVLPLAVDYGQRHRRELDAAREVATLAGLPLAVADLSGLRPLLRGSSQTDDAVPVPEGHYTDATMKATVVPNRNMVFLATAAAHAVSSGAGFVAFAAHAGDHHVYPDCRPEFVEAMRAPLMRCHDSPIRLLTPFLLWTKGGIVARGDLLGAPLGQTWSCYVGAEKHCGRCGACVERRLAFTEAGVPDPTEYE